MTATSWAITDDVNQWVVVLTVALLLGSVILLLQELRSRRQRSWLIFTSGPLGGSVCVPGGGQARRGGVPSKLGRA
jgi:hypothetical protein